MKIQIGIQNVSREIDLDVDLSVEELQEKVTRAIQGQETLVLNDVSGKSVILPAGTLAYVSTSSTEARRVGFGFAN